MPASVIIVGGGPGGLYLAKALGANKGLKVTVVSALDYWDYSISSPRCITEPGETTSQKYTPPMAEICKFLACDFVHGKVVEVSTSGVKMESGDSLSADCVVVAIGGAYAGGAIWKARPDETTAPARLKGFEAISAELQAAEEVVVSGAGLVGVEVAGEIKSKYPKKKARSLTTQSRYSHCKIAAQSGTLRDHYTTTSPAPPMQPLYILPSGRPVAAQSPSPCPAPAQSP